MIAMETAEGKASREERDRLVLVRTAGIVSWIYAAERTLVGLGAPGTFATLCLVHAVLLGAAGAALFGDRRWAWAPVLAAAGGAVAFAIFEGLHSCWMNAGVDAAYAVVAAFALLRRRHSA